MEGGVVKRKEDYILLLQLLDTKPPLSPTLFFSYLLLPKSGLYQMTLSSALTDGHRRLSAIFPSIDYTHLSHCKCPSIGPQHLQTNPHSLPFSPSQLPFLPAFHWKIISTQPLTSFHALCFFAVRHAVHATSKRLCMALLCI